MRSFPFFKQLDSMDCGPTCLRMIAKYYGRNYALQTLRAKSGINREGVSMLGISEAAEAIGLKTIVVKTTIEKLSEEGIFPLIAHWNQVHFIVVYKIKGDSVYVADPGNGLLVYNKKEFQKLWISTREDNENLGIVMLLEPSEQFYREKGEKPAGLTFKLLFNHLFRYKNLIFQLLLGLLAGSLLQLIFPFLTQAIVDKGITTKDISFIYLILLAQLMLFIGQTSVDFIRSWVLLHMNTRLSISILTDFLVKLMKLPIAFFEGKMVGDIIQRIGDQQRIQNFLTGPTLSILFSFINIVVFTFVIIHYNLAICLVFFAGSVIYVTWVLLFLKYRRALDYKRFNISSHNQTNIIQLVHGMQEIKMNNLEISKRWEWEKIQAKIFKVGIKGLELTQYQQGGASFINQLKNIFITFLAALAVVHGQMTLGAMLAIQYIVGQMNGPIEQFIQFVQILQDAKISMERLNEIQTLPDEESFPADKIFDIPKGGDLEIKGVEFTYPGAGNEPVLNQINLTIPRGKITAIVGVSGSGKTTLMKTLMKFYIPGKGNISVSGIDLADISNKAWRQKCGAVMQDSYFFPDTIFNNIALSDHVPDHEKLNRAVHIANISDLIQSLPLGLNTKIGVNGSGLSQGQKQRILIARVAYKDPEFIFLDEATNSLDANNEKVIMENLDIFFKGKTVVIAAHRLSTVKHADQIVVMEQGKPVEIGTHKELILLKGNYFTLVKNQLELDG